MSCRLAAQTAVALDGTSRNLKWVRIRSSLRQDDLAGANSFIFDDYTTSKTAPSHAMFQLKCLLAMTDLFLFRVLIS
jgi:hypothetical protein